MRFLVVVFAPLLTCCAMIQAAEVDDQVQRMYGLTEQQVLGCLGPATARQAAGDLDVWSYHSAGAIRSSAGVYGNSYGAFGSGTTWQEQCQINLSFRGGTVVNVNYRAMGPLVGPSSSCYPVFAACVGG